ncbi:hypothetical protein J0676_18085 [Vibrio sp. Vb2880]|uniref:GNAT family N-acetyltransferase n=1 Tax=Vibrio TaxID=662 RepID=UPI0005A504CB|nr:MULTISPECIES: GNAT family N-acetyltransferase [Vibrio]MBO0215420.1 hypothetical protein [Vibrio sp. Vb2880]
MSDKYIKTQPISGHGIHLIPLNEEYLEVLRNWRNSDFVKGFLFSQKEITKEEQINWFHSLEKNDKYYFIIKDDEGYYGACNLNFKYDSNGLAAAEGGIFAGNETKLNSLTPIKAIFLLYDWGFESKELDHVDAHIKSDNKRALRFNKGVGFKVINESDDVVSARLTSKDFYLCYERYKKLLG